MMLERHIRAIMEAPTVEVAAAMIRLQSEMERRKKAAEKEMGLDNDE